MISRTLAHSLAEQRVAMFGCCVSAWFGERKQFLFFNFYSSRSDVSIKNHWKTIRKRAQMGFYRDEADSISLDIQQFVKGEVEHLFSRAC